MVPKLPATASSHHQQCTAQRRGAGSRPATPQLRYLRRQRRGGSRSGAARKRLRRGSHTHVAHDPIHRSEHGQRFGVRRADSKLDSDTGVDGHPGQRRRPAGDVPGTGCQWKLFSRVPGIRRRSGTPAHLRGVATEPETKAPPASRGGFLLHGRGRSRPLLQLRRWSEGLGRQRRALGTACPLAKSVPLRQADEGPAVHRFPGSQASGGRGEGGYSSSCLQCEHQQQQYIHNRNLRGGIFGIGRCGTIRRSFNGRPTHLRQDCGGLVRRCSTTCQQQRFALHSRGEDVQDLLWGRVQHDFFALRPCGGVRQVRLIRYQVPTVPQTLYRCDACIFFLRDTQPSTTGMNKKCMNSLKLLWFVRRSQRPAVGQPFSWPLEQPIDRSLVEKVSLQCNISVVQRLYALFIIKLTYYRNAFVDFQCMSVGVGDWIQKGSGLR